MFWILHGNDFEKRKKATDELARFFGDIPRHAVDELSFVSQGIGDFLQPDLFSGPKVFVFFGALEKADNQEMIWFLRGRIYQTQTLSRSLKEAHEKKQKIENQWIGVIQAEQGNVNDLPQLKEPRNRKTVQADTKLQNTIEKKAVFSLVRDSAKEVAA